MRRLERDWWRSEPRHGDRTKSESLRPPPLRPLPSPATALATLHAVSHPPRRQPPSSERPWCAPYCHILPETLHSLPEAAQKTTSPVYRFSHPRQRQPPDSELHALKFRTSVPSSRLARRPILRLLRQPHNFGRSRQPSFAPFTLPARSLSISRQPLEFGRPRGPPSHVELPRSGPHVSRQPMLFPVGHNHHCRCRTFSPPPGDVSHLLAQATRRPVIRHHLPESRSRF